MLLYVVMGLKVDDDVMNHGMSGECDVFLSWKKMEVVM